MNKKSHIFQTKLINILTGVFTLFFIKGNAFAEADTYCLPAKGKIVNNLQVDGSTLGVVHLILGNERFKCAISGNPQSQLSGVDYKHTAVCDDETSSEDAQAQVTFDTHFISITPTGSCAGSPYGPASFSFIEESIPDPNTARGAFSGITASRGIVVQGNLNCNTGGIKMEFEGEFCFNNSNDD